MAEKAAEITRLIPTTEMKVRKVLVVDPDRCTACHSCEMACAQKHFHRTSPYLSRIRIIEFRDIMTFIPIVCQACEDAVCMKVCPVGARIRKETGAVVTDEDLCIGCKACVYACPLGAPVVNPETGKVMTCDLCDGEDPPWCVRACTMQGALQFVPVTQVSETKSMPYAWKLKEEYKPPVIEEKRKYEFAFGVE